MVSRWFAWWWVLCCLLLITACSQAGVQQAPRAHVQNQSMQHEILNKSAQNESSVTNKESGLPRAEPAGASLPRGAPVQSEAQVAARRIVKLWNEKAWGQLYQFLPLKTRLRMTERAFKAMMEVVDFDVRLEHDERYAYLLKDPQLDQLLKVNLSLQNVQVRGANASFLVNITVGGVPFGVDFFSLSWEKGWWLRNPLPGTSPEGVCRALNYSDYCFFRLAVAFQNASLCAESGPFFLQCYQALGVPVPHDVALAICGEETTKSGRGACLKNVVLATGDGFFCDKIGMILYRTECLGILGGYAGDIEKCFSALNASPGSRKWSTLAGWCAYGYVLATGELDACHYIDKVYDRELFHECVRVAQRVSKK